ncbi:MAG: S8 family peptidase [Saprospiraceae bacterium]
MKKLIFVMLLISYNFFAFGQEETSKDWYFLDLSNDNVPGISVYKTYNELLKGRKSEPVVVAVIDGGVDYLHEDLRDIMWHNPGEKPNNGIDDDKNGYVDDVYGWNFIGGSDGRDVNQDNLEVTRLYKKYNYKYKDVTDPSKLSKAQKKEYEIYKESKAELEGEKVKAAESLDRYKTRKMEIFKSLDQVQKELDAKGLTYAQVGSLTETDDDGYNTSLALVKRVQAADPDLKSIQDIKDLIGSDFQRGIDYFTDKVMYHYNPDFNPRSVVGDNYDDSSEKYYGNGDVKGPDADHGTHVSGIIAAVRGNNIGMDGIADNVKIMGVRVVPNGDERDKDVANGIRYAVDNGAKIINMSFGKSFKWDKKVVDDAVKYAMKKGVLLVHAAGNDNQNNDVANNFPTDKYDKKGFCGKKYAKNWIEVGASSYMNDSLFVAEFSNYGAKNVDVFAPGVAIYSTIPENQYASFQGTSMASPVVAGVAAVLKSYFPGLSAKEIKSIILESSVKKTFKVVEPGTGELVPFSALSVSGGEVNLYNAVKLAMDKYGKKAAK